jgi:hypothetical protein
MFSFRLELGSQRLRAIFVLCLFSRFGWADFFILPILDLVRGEARLCTVVYSIKKEKASHGQGLSQVFSWNVLSFFAEEKFVHVVRMFFL